MIFKLHNSFEIVSGKNRQTIFNTVLSGANAKFLNGDAYTDYIAFGDGVHADLTGVTSLQNQIGIKESVITGINTDISKGCIYIKRTIELGEDEYNGVTIRELGFTANEGCDLFNYALTGSGVTKNAGETLSITATVYITLSNTDNICGGNNPLFELLFGLKRPSNFNIEAVFSDGSFFDGGVIRSDYNVLARMPVSVVVREGKLVTEAVLPQSCDYAEVLLTMNGIPAFCFNARAYSGTLISETVSLTAEYGDAQAEVIGLQGVSGVMCLGSPVPYSSVAVASGASDVYKNPFGIIVKEKDKVFSSVNGNYFAVFGGGGLEVYCQSGTGIKKLSVEGANFAYKDIDNIMLDNNGNMYVHINASPHMSFFCKSGDSLVCYNTERSYSNNIIYNALTQYGGDVYTYYIISTNETYMYECYKATFSGGLFRETLIKSEIGSSRHFYSRSENTEILCNPDNRTSRTYPNGLTVSPVVTELLFGCTDAVICGGFIFIKEGLKIRLFGLSSGTEYKIYESGVRRIFLSEDGTMVKLYANNKLSGVYADGRGLKLYPFEIDKRINGEITKAEVSKKGVLITAKTRFSDCYYLPFCCDKCVIRCIPLAMAREIEISVTLTRKSFKNQSGRRLYVETSIE